MSPAAVALGALSFLACFANGVLGAGNQVIFVPMALYALPLAGVRVEAHAVAALSLVLGVCTVAVGTPIYARRGHLEYRQLWLGGPALGAGGLAGGLLSAAAPAWLLVLVFAVLATGAAVVLLLPPPRRQRAEAPSHARQVGVMLLFAGIGALGGAAGIGAGVLVIPALLYVLATPARSATGTGLVLPAFVSAPAFVGKALTGQVPWALVPAVALAAVVGTAAGALITVAISPTALRRGLSGLTAVLALTVWAQLLLPLARP